MKLQSTTQKRLFIASILALSTSHQLFAQLGLDEMDGDELGTSFSMGAYEAGLKQSGSASSYSAGSVDFDTLIFGDSGSTQSPASIAEPTVAESQTPVESRVATADLDSDGDGVADGRDSCPDTLAVVDVDAFGCEMDRDGDGILDSRDRCQGTPAFMLVDSEGCQLAESGGEPLEDPSAPLVADNDQKRCEVIQVDLSLSSAPFNLGSDALSPLGQKVWNTIAGQLLSHPKVVIELAGYTDNSGPAAYNLALSLRRAAAVAEFLVAAGVPEQQLRVKGYGEADPIADNSTRQGRISNRRVEAHMIETVAGLPICDLPVRTASTSKPIAVAVSSYRSQTVSDYEVIRINTQVEDETQLVRWFDVITTFDLYSFQDLAEADKQEWASVAEQLKQRPELQVEVAGYSDSTGSHELNDQLSLLRAETIRDYLISLGIEEDRVTAKGYGERDPIADNSTKAGRAANRRVELHVV